MWRQDNRWFDLGALTDLAFRRYALGTFASLVGTRMQRLVIAWIAWDATHSGTWLGLIAFAELFPIVLFAPLAGVAIDRFGPLKVLFGAQAAAVVQSGVLLYLHASGALTGPALLAVTFLLGAAAAFNAPADLGMMPHLVDRPRYASAISIGSFLSNVGVLLGPALAGVILATFGAGPAIALNAVSSVALLGVLCTLGKHRHSGAGREQQSNLDLRGAWTEVSELPAVAAMIVVAGAISLSCRAFIQILPSYSAGVLLQGSAFLGWCTGCIGVGAALGGLWMSRSRQRKVIVNRVAVSALASALVLVILAVQSQAWSGLVLFFAFGVCLGINGVGTQSFVQLFVDQRIRGRILAFYSMAFRGGIALGALFLGFLVSLGGARTALAAGAVACVAVWACMNLKRKSLDSSQAVSAHDRLAPERKGV